MAKENEKGVFMDANTSKDGTMHMNFYGSDPKQPHDETIHINIKPDGTGTIVEKSNGTKTVTNIDLNKKN